MEGSSVNSMCRCCASEGASKDIKTSYHWMGEEEVYADMIRECFEVTLSSADQGGICEVCITQLRNAANFKKQVLNTESQFKQHLRTKGFKGARVKEELSVFDDNDSDDMDNGDDEDYIPEYEVPIKTESESEDKPKKRSAKTVTTRAKKSKSGDRDAAVKSFERIISNIKRKGDNTGWGITIKAIKTESQFEDQKDETVQTGKSKIFLKPQGVALRKKEKKDTPIPDTVKNLLKKHNIWCKRPPTPIVDHKFQLDKHRHNIRMILQNSNATPFRAYDVHDGFGCCFCTSFIETAAKLKSHTIEKHNKEIETFKENSTSIFTYVVKLDITGLCCNLCKSQIDNIEGLIDHLQLQHQIVFNKDIKNHIVSFKFESEVIRCFMCSYEFSNFKFLLEHMNEHYRNYICLCCNAGFINHRMLVAHADGQDLTVGEIKCPICNEVFEQLAKYRRHEIMSHSGFDLTSHKCAHCGQNFRSDENLRDHVEKDHKGQHEYKCGGCDKLYFTKTLLIDHTKRVHLHENKQFKCNVCSRTFYELQLLKNHMIRHSDTKRFQCDRCALMFKSKGTLRRHLRTHKLRGEFKCLACEESFFRKTYLDDHMRQVHLNDVRIKCKVCDKAFYESQMKNHMVRSHHELQTYQCDMCSEVCSSKHIMIQHMGSHSNMTGQKQYKYECLACGKKFDRQIYLTKHTQRVHLLERKFVCDQCGRKFADTTTLKNHVATHSDANKFQCFGCPRTFKTKKTMMNHARNHMEERKVRCEICLQGFIYPYLLKEHMKQTHKMSP